MSAPLLRICNHHAVGSGDPPIVDDNVADQNIGYFENRFGEQWVFTRDKNTGVATLRGGDIGWHENIDVTEGVTYRLVLNPNEFAWLQVCLEVSRR